MSACNSHCAHVPSCPDRANKLTRQRDEDGKPYVLDSVRKAEDILHQQKSDKEYLPITVSLPKLSR